MPVSNPDRNLLFGLLALQNDFVSREDLLVAASVWLQDKSQLLDQILLDRKLLDEDEHSLLSQLVRKHLQRHDGDPQKSLGAVNPVDALVHRQLGKLGDEEIGKSLGLGTVPGVFKPTPSYHIFEPAKCAAATNRAQHVLSSIRIFHGQTVLAHDLVLMDVPF